MPERPPPPVYRLRGWRRATVWLLSLVLRAWAATLRYQITPADAATFREGQRGGVVVLWHNRLFVYAHLYRRYLAPTKVSALISASRDGAWLAALYECLGMEAVRGSSSKRGARAARELLKRLDEGGLVALTVDGPRGPRYTINPGAAMVAAKSNAPVLVVVPHFSAAWRLKSWDRFFVPVPFSRVRLVLKRAESAGALAASRERAAVSEALRRALSDLSRGSDPEFSTVAE